MKTKILRPVVIAALSVISLTIVAQNIKSTSYKHESKLIALLEGENEPSSLDEELDIQLNKLMELCKYFPRNNEIYLTDITSVDILAEVNLELEKEIKFKPEESIVNSSDEMIILEEISNELKDQVKYRPSESIVDADKENSQELSEVLTQLYDNVKYKPIILL